jgi:hypothetical protein
MSGNCQHHIYGGDTSMLQDSNLHTLTHVVINDLKKAYITCLDRPAEVFILSAMVTAKKVHDQLITIDSSDTDPEDYCSAI